MVGSPLLFVIGGPCRTGKSTLARMLHAAVGVPAVPTDALVWMLQVGAPDLGVRHGRLVDKAERLFPFLMPFVDAYTASGATLVLEGDAIGPLEASALAHQHNVRACFIGHSGARPEDLTLDDGWAARHSSEQLSSLAHFVAEGSLRLAAECRRAGWPYFDIAQHGRASALAAALESLLDDSAC